MQSRSELPGSRRVIVKIGSALLTAGGKGLDQPAIAHWVKQIAELRRRGMQVVLVSSGSIAEGMSRLGWKTRPHRLNELQAAASVGQMGLVQTYASLFKRHGLQTAQILLTHDDLSNRERYLNSRSTILTLLELGVIPVINENDTVTTEEIRFGDNDTLGALVANAVEADLLVILTDQAGLFERNPSLDPSAPLVSQAGINDPRLDGMVSDSLSGLGRGGMITKLRAARLAARSGTATVIASGRESGVLPRILDGEILGTLLIPDVSPLIARKRWMAGQLKLKGSFVIDEGAERVLRGAGKSLLPIGVTAVEGEFRRGDLVACVNQAGREIARGLTNYSSDESRLIMRQPSTRIEEILGYVDEPELIHRDNLVLS
ncbi:MULTISPECIES: glutamate 5-kinase [Methylococcus]|uniref:Glutamate 5-kinase n=1 Tax=Methylococcus capsulatus TaxID=414 RepID=A0ABZ2F4X8_METCP|nr:MULTISPECIES: glutamate 5-kinase [Methylococcus]MDF9393374.1 glutamate 5-kinase [Methylococcus capsulatus]